MRLISFGASFWVFCFGLIFMASSAQAVDMSHMFPADSKTSPAAAAAVRSWFQDNCPDLTWALSVNETPAAHQSCGDGIEQVHVEVALSHLNSEFIFWVRETGDQSAEIQWVHEEWPSWHICSYADSFTRDNDLTCKNIAPPLY